MVVLTCLLPAVPNGFIPYAAVNAKMKLRDYTLAVVIGAAPPKIVLTAIGERIFEGQWLLLVVLIIIACIGAFILMRYQKQTVDFFIRLIKKVTGSKSDNISVNEEPSLTPEKPEAPDIHNDLMEKDKSSVIK